MNFKGFQLFHYEPFDNSIMKKEYIKIYHQQGAQINQSDQNIEFIFGEINIYHQTGNAYLEFNITIRKRDSTNFHHEDPIRLVKNAFAFCFKEARLSTTIGSIFEHIKFCGRISTFMKVISNKDGDILSQFYNISENNIPIRSRVTDLPPQFRSTPHQIMLKDNHIDDNRGKNKRYLYLEDIFSFCKSFRKVTKNLGLHLMLKTNDLPDFIYTSGPDDIKVTINSLYLFVPNLTPSVETQLMLNETTQNKYKISYDEFYREGRLFSDMIVQVDIRSVQQVNSPIYLISAHQMKDRIDTPIKMKMSLYLIISNLKNILLN